MDTKKTMTKKEYQKWYYKYRYNNDEKFKIKELLRKHNKYINDDDFREKIKNKWKNYYNECKLKIKNKDINIYNDTDNINIDNANINIE